MTRETDASAQRIDLQRGDELKQWARKLDASEAQIKEAVQAVGDRASDVEEHLKGSRSTTNAERTRQALKQPAADRPDGGPGRG
jgi:methyl-accepting chemotaxis protein